MVRRLRRSLTVRLLSAVDASVSVERARRAEALATDIADVRFLSCKTEMAVT
jgi:hypothetical protein